jgi:branched-chain amino acid transport system permease protein
MKLSRWQPFPIAVTIPTVVIVLVMLLLPVFMASPQYLHLLCMVFIYIVLSLGMYSVWSVGYLNAAHPAFYGVGAYTSALLMLRAGLPFWLTLPIAGIVSATLAAIIGYPGLRVRGAQFLILGIAFNEVVRWIFTTWKSLFGGANGIINIPDPEAIRILGLTIDFTTSLVPYYYLTMILCFMAVFVYFRIHWSRLGRVWTSMRQNEGLLAATGVSVLQQKMICLITACFFAGLAGAVYASFMSAIAPEMFGFMEGIYYFLAVLIGGISTPVGPIIGVGFMTILRLLLRGFPIYQELVWGFILILVLVSFRKGIVGLPEMMKRRPAKKTPVYEEVAG